MYYFIISLALLLFTSESGIAAPPAVLDELQIYLLPNEHPAKPTLDSIFKKSRPTLCYEALENAGFTTYPRRKTSQVYCARHPRLKGYLIKTFLDQQAEIQEEWAHWLRRIRGADQMRAWIESHAYGHFFKAPRKWIYPIPQTKKNPPHSRLRPQEFLLVVEDMQTLSETENKKAWIHRMTEAHLNALYFALTENLLIDSIYIDNIPFCKDGRIAFLDTEHINVTHIPLVLSRLLPRLSPPMAHHWRALIPNYTNPVGAP